MLKMSVHKITLKHAFTQLLAHLAGDTWSGGCCIWPFKNNLNPINQSVTPWVQLVNTLRPRWNGQHFADDIFKRIFFNENVWISIKISLTFVPKGPIYNNPALVQIMAQRLPGDKPLSEPMMDSLLTHIGVTRPQWVKWLHAILTQCLVLCHYVMFGVWAMIDLDLVIDIFKVIPFYISISNKYIVWLVWDRTKCQIITISRCLICK